jgi:hypothetical protein
MVASRDNWGVMSLGVTVDCDTAQLLLQEQSNYLYKNLPGTALTMKLRLVRPLDDPASMPQVYDRTEPFGTLAIPLFQDGLYSLVAETVRQYQPVANVLVRFKYTYRQTVQVSCAVDLCGIITAFNKPAPRLHG